MKFQIEEENERIDLFLSKKLDVSRSKVVKNIDKILVNDNPVKASYTVKNGDVVTVLDFEEEITDIIPEDIPIDIVFENDDLIVINKANGMVVHPAIGNKTKTLVNALLYHFNSLSSDSIRPGIVHRIDAYTTGLLMVAKNDKTHELLSKQLSLKTATRKYIALVWGVIKNDTGTIDAPIGRDFKDRKKMGVTSTNSKDAITHFKVLQRFKNATLIELQLETGRTHQIRVHMNYIGYPIVNDPVYGRRKIIDQTGQCLHAKTLGFMYNDEYMEFDSELPECFTNILNTFEE